MDQIALSVCSNNGNKSTCEGYHDFHGCQTNFNLEWFNQPLLWALFLHIALENLEVYENQNAIN